jgi:AMP-polyphosphate phosphotransferase
MSRLDEVDLSLTLTVKEQDELLARHGDRLAQLRLTLGGVAPYADGRFTLGPPLCCVFEGWDASGKGGAIKRLVTPLDPRHVRVRSYAAPTYDEKRHHYLLRFTDNLPGWGGMSVYDRSWYGRVLVERVEGFASPDEWKRAYDEIAGFEHMLVLEGMIFVKVWLHVSSREQLRRFRKRAKDPLKTWKLTDEDWRNRKKRKRYTAAVEEMIERTHTPEAPWHIVAGDSKKWARVNVMETVIAEIERGMRRHGLEPPEPLF